MADKTRQSTKTSRKARNDASDLQSTTSTNLEERVAPRRAGGRPPKHPWKHLPIATVHPNGSVEGVSFTLPRKPSSYGMAYQHGKRHGMKFTVRAIEGNKVAIFRIE